MVSQSRRRKVRCVPIVATVARTVTWVPSPSASEAAERRHVAKVFVATRERRQEVPDRGDAEASARPAQARGTGQPGAADGRVEAGLADSGGRLPGHPYSTATSRCSWRWPPGTISTSASHPASPMVVRSRSRSCVSSRTPW